MNDPSYVYVHPSSWSATVHRTIHVTDNVLVDLDKFGRAIGVETLSGPELDREQVEMWATAGERIGTHLADAEDRLGDDLHPDTVEEIRARITAEETGAARE